MTRQSEVLAGIKLKSESTIQSLRHKLERLEDLVSSNTSHTQSLQESLTIMERHERNIDLLPVSDIAEETTEASRREVHIEDSQYTRDSRRRGVELTDDVIQDRTITRRTRSDELIDDRNGASEGALSIDELQTGNRVAFRERRQEETGRGEGGQPRGILKRRVPSDEQRDALEYQTHGRDGSAGDGDRGRRHSDDLSSSQSEVSAMTEILHE